MKHFRILLVLVSSAFIVSCSASKRTQRSIEKELSDSPVFQQGYTGFALFDPSEEKILYEHQAHKYFTPASNTKILTLYTGLNTLGDTLKGLEYTTKADSLFFKGTGDPSFLNPDLPGSKIFNFLKNSEKHLVYVPPKFREKHFGPGWAWDDYDSYYSTEKSAMPVYGNLIRLKFENNNSPVVSPAIFGDSIHKATEIRNKYAQREISSNQMTFKTMDRGDQFNQAVPIKFSDEILVKLLADTLKKPVHIYRGGKNLNFEHSIKSVATDSVYKQMMQVSDNFIAEQLLLMAAEKLSDSLKTDIAIDHIKKQYLNDLPDDLKWVDGSGLSRYNLFTPRSLVMVLHKIRKSISEDRLFNIFPAGGESGTIKNHYKAESPYIYAKTGSLRNNHSLSGYIITKSGRTLIFSFMNSNYTVPSSVLKKGMADILEKVRDNY